MYAHAISFYILIKENHQNGIIFMIPFIVITPSYFRRLPLKNYDLLVVVKGVMDGWYGWNIE